MIHFLHSGKFWLKSAVIGAVIALLLLGCGYLGLQYAFNLDNIHAITADMLRTTGRSVRFDERNISRSLFPRPTLTLRDVHISQPNNSSIDAIFIRETKIGFAWKNVFTDSTDIEKWVLKGASVSLSQFSDGTWSLQDFWQAQNQNARVNRLMVENSHLSLQTMRGNYQINDFGLSSENEGEIGRKFEVNGIIQNHALPQFNWQGNGIVNYLGNHWEIPALHVETQGRLKDETLKIGLNSSVWWQPQSNELRIRDLSVQADSSYQNLHFTAQSPDLVWKTDHVNIGELNSSFTATPENKMQWNGSLSADKISLRTSVATVGSFELKSSIENEKMQTNFSASGPLTWQRGKELQSNHIHVVTHQDSSNRAHAPRFGSVLEGSFSLTDLQHWKASLKGLFDKQPTAINLKYSADEGTPAKLEAGIALQKLSLEPYWDDLANSAVLTYPGWLTQSWSPEFEASVKIGSFSSPSLQLDNIDTLLSANRERILLSNFKAGLYGGTTEGGIGIANTTPLAYHLQQNAQGVQMRPLLQDMFGFHSIQGSGNAVIDATMQGSDIKSLVHTLKGSLNMEVLNGAWLGIDLNNILKSTSISGRIQNDQSLQTPFRRFSMSSEIENGVARHDDTHLWSDNLHITSHGATDWNKRLFSEEMLISHATDKSARPIPLKITGPIDNPSVTIDFNRLTDGMSTPEERQKALSNALKEQWKWLSPK